MLCVRVSEIDNPMKTLNLLGGRYASTRASTAVSVLTTVYSKKWNGKEHM